MAASTQYSWGFSVSFHKDYALAGFKNPKSKSACKDQAHRPLPQAKGDSSSDGFSGGSGLIPVTSVPSQDPTSACWPFPLRGKINFKKNTALFKNSGNNTSWCRVPPHMRHAIFLGFLPKMHNLNSITRKCQPHPNEGVPKIDRPVSSKCLDQKRQGNTRNSHPWRKIKKMSDWMRCGILGQKWTFMGKSGEIRGKPGLV